MIGHATPRQPYESLEVCFRSQSPEWRRFLSRFAKTTQQVAYYPSAYRDLRPLLNWKTEGLRHQGIEVPIEYHEPDLWVFSDYFPQTGSAIFDAETLHDDGRTTIRSLDSCEIHPVAGEFERRVNRAYTAFPPSSATGRSMWFRVRVESDRLGTYEADGIYFFYENVNLIHQLFLRHAVPVTHLTWKRDGASFGGGRMIHGFLRFLPAAMGTRWFLLEDRYLQDHVLDVPWPDELMRWREDFTRPMELHRLGAFDWDGSDRIVFLQSADGGIQDLRFLP